MNILHVKLALYQRNEIHILDQFKQSGDYNYKIFCAGRHKDQDVKGVEYFDIKNNIFLYYLEGFFIRVFRVSFYLLYLIKFKKIDLVYFHYGYEEGLLLPRCKKIFPKIPMIVQFHGFDASTIIKKFPNIYKKLFKYADKIMVSNSNHKKRFINAGCNENKIIVRPMGVDCSKLGDMKMDFVKKDNIFNISYLGRLTGKKGIIDLLKALKIIITSNKNIYLHVIGDGELRTDVEKFIDENNLHDFVKLYGMIVGDEKHYIIKNTQVFVLPSKVGITDGDEEGAPLALMEAGDLGLPLITTNHPGNNDIVKDGYNGYVVNEGDYNKIAEKIIFLINHKNLIKEFGNNSKELIKNNFNFNKQNNKLFNIYDSLISGKK